ncbi:MAG: energy-coupling factor transporter transmembrane component T family protein [Fidelibacterota bacterium]
MGLDPRVKLLGALTGMVVLFFIGSSGGQLIFLVLLVLFGRLQKLRLGQILAALHYLWVFLILTFFIHFLFIGDGWQWLSGETRFHRALVEQPLLLSLRLANLILWMGLLLRWLPAMDFLDALYYLLKPLRRLGWRSDNLFQVVFIAVRFFPILRDEYRRLDEGWQIISGTPGKTLRARLRQARQSIIPLMIFSFQKAETLADAMTVRGYQTRTERSYYRMLQWRTGDWLSAALMLAGLFVVILWR